MSLLALCLAAAAAASAEPAESSTVPKLWAAIEAMEAEHGELTKRFDANLKEMAALREAYPSSGDKAALRARWEALGKKCQEDLERENTLRKDKRSDLNVLKFELLARAVPVAGKPPPDPAADGFTRKMAFHETRSTHFKSASERMIAAYNMEEATFRATVAAHGAGGRLWIPAAVAGAVAVAAAAVWLRRPRGARTAALKSLPPAMAGADIELGELLGRGAMGEVYAGRDRTLERAVAVKRLRPELCGNPSELDRLLAQARLMAGLKHPHIVQVHSVERDGGDAFLVLELAPGKTLAALLAAGGPLPWEDARRIARAVAEGLDYAHVRGVTHGDLKPSNIMVAPDGGVKVMDFALAYAAKATVSRLTRSDAFGGLPYMSPEQELGEPGPAADAYALAACFYEALTSKRPFPGPDFLAQKRAGDFTPPSALAKRLPPGADALFKIAFNPNPESRYQGPAAFAAAADVL